MFTKNPGLSLTSDLGLSSVKGPKNFIKDCFALSYIFLFFLFKKSLPVKTSSLFFLLIFAVLSNFKASISDGSFTLYFLNCLNLKPKEAIKSLTLCLSAL